MWLGVTARRSKDDHDKREESRETEDERSKANAKGGVRSGEVVNYVRVMRYNKKSEGERT